MDEPTSPPGVTPVPTPAPIRNDRATFSPRVDGFVTWVINAVAQFNLLATWVYTTATEVFDNATSAFNSATDSAESATAAGAFSVASADSATDSAASASEADTAKLAAEAAATASAASAQSLTANSTTSLAIGNGTKAFTVPTGKQFPNGEPVSVTSTGAPTNKMFGTVASYTGPNLTLTITHSEGSGTFNDWVIAPAGAQGPVGGTAGGALTSALELKKGIDLASASTINPWTTGGNFMDLTGGATVNAIDPAPQAGSARTLYVTGTPTITNNANIVVKGGTVTLVAGDQIDLEARTTTQILVTVRRGAGFYNMTFKHRRVYRASAVHTAKVTGLHMVELVGAPGGGGVVGNIGGSCATGGGAGGVCKALRYLVAGMPYSFTSGSGAPNVTYMGAPINGTAGGATTFVVSGYATMTANGGQGGNAALVGPLLGGLGGTASGGDINLTGGRGGNITGSTATGLYATGGGAPATQGVAYNGGDIVTGGINATASGGAATGGKGGDAAGGGRGGGGGAGGPGGDALSNNNGAAGVNLDGDVNSFGGSSPSLAQYAWGWANVSGAGCPGIVTGGTTIAPVFGGATAGVIGVASAATGFAAMGGSAGFTLNTARQQQGPGGGVGGYAGSDTSGNPTGGISDGGWMMISWND